MDTEVNSGTFTGFDDFFFNLFAYFGYYLFNTCRVDTSVGYQLVQSQTGYLTTYGVKCRKNDCFRSVIYYDFYTCSSFQCTDITSFTTDNTSFDFVRFNVEYGYRVLNGCFRSYPLNRLYHNAFCFFTGCQLGIVHDIIDVGLRLCFGLFFQRFYQAFFCFFGRQTGKCFQLFYLLMLQFVQFFFLLINNSQLGFQIFSYGVSFCFLALNLFLTLAQYHFALFQFIFSLLNLLITLRYFFFQICFFVEEFLLNFQQFVFLYHFRFGFRLFQDVIVFGL